MMAMMLLRRHRIFVHLTNSLNQSIGLFIVTAHDTLKKKKKNVSFKETEHSFRYFQSNDLSDVLLLAPE